MTGSVRISTAASTVGNVPADAVRIERLESSVWTVDDGDPDCLLGGTISTQTGSGYNNDYRTGIAGSTARGASRSPPASIASPPPGPSGVSARRPPVTTMSGRRAG